MPSVTWDVYGSISWRERASVMMVMLQLPFFLAWRFAISPFASRSKYKTWRRVLGDEMSRLMASSLNAPQLQYVMGTTVDMYGKWAKQSNKPVVIEELGDDARVLWITPKRNDRLIVYVHGGGFLLPMIDAAAAYWEYIGLELKRKDIDVGVVVVSYTLIPPARFPTQLCQVVSGFKHLFASGVQPKDMQVVGDSAGASLMVQLISHILHPYKDVPPLSLPSPFGGFYLMSPWLSFSKPTPSHFINDRFDWVPARVFAANAHSVIITAPESYHIYLEAAKAPDSWFEGAEKLVERVLISAGELECLRDDVTQFTEKLRMHHAGVRYVVQKNGIHVDPFCDSVVAKPSELTIILLDWLSEGFA